MAHIRSNTRPCFPPRREAVEGGVGMCEVEDAVDCGARRASGGWARHVKHVRLSERGKLAWRKGKKRLVDHALAESDRQLIQRDDQQEDCQQDRCDMAVIVHVVAALELLANAAGADQADHRRHPNVPI